MRLGLQNEKDLDIQFPLEEITSDYLNASISFFGIALLPSSQKSFWYFTLISQKIGLEPK